MRGLCISHIHSKRFGNGADARIRDEPCKADRDEGARRDVLGLRCDPRRRTRGRRRNSLRADVTAGARALLTTQASTKVYRSLRRSRQSLTANVDADALLAVVPDPIVCFADADFTQTQRYDLHADASLVMVDWITSGRHAAGERWAFSRYESRFDIRRGSQRVFFDALVLEPRHRLRRGADGPLRRAVDRSHHRAARRRGRDGSRPSSFRRRQSHAAPTWLFSAARLRDGGALLRMAGTSVEQMGHTLRSHLAFLSPLTGDDLWSRKW